MLRVPGTICVRASTGERSGAKHSGKRASTEVGGKRDGRGPTGVDRRGSGARCANRVVLCCAKHRD